MENRLKTRRYRLAATLILIFLLPVFSIGILGQSQWASVGTEWHYSFNLNSAQRFVSEKDTTVEGNKCQIVKGKYSSDIMYEAEGKVYYHFGGKFNLVYDFLANVGETIPFVFRGIGHSSSDTTYEARYVVKSIESIKVGNATFKRFQTDLVPDHLDQDMLSMLPPSYNYLEHIGIEEGYLKGIMVYVAVFTPESLQRLRCYDNATSSYVADWWAVENKPCDYDGIASTNRQQAEVLKINYNSVIGELAIEVSDASDVSRFTAKIHNLAGQILMEIPVDSSPQKIDIRRLKQGIYFLSVSDGLNTVGLKKIDKL